MMIRLKAYDQDKNYSTLCGLFEMNGMSPVEKMFLPAIGHIAYQDRTPIAAGFLVCTDTSLCILEHFVGNPNVDWKIRGEAITMLIKELVEDARFLGFSRAAASFRNDRLISKVEKAGFNIEKRTSNWAMMEV